MVRVLFVANGWVVRLEEPRPAAPLKQLDRRWFGVLQKSALAGRICFHFGSSEAAGVPRFGWILAGTPRTPHLPRAFASDPALGEPLAQGCVLPRCTDCHVTTARQYYTKNEPIRDAPNGSGTRIHIDIQHAGCVHLGKWPEKYFGFLKKLYVSKKQIPKTYITDPSWQW